MQLKKIKYFECITHTHLVVSRAFWKACAPPAGRISVCRLSWSRWRPSPPLTWCRGHRRTWSSKEGPAGGSSSAAAKMTAEQINARFVSVQAQNAKQQQQTTFLRQSGWCLFYRHTCGGGGFENKFQMEIWNFVLTPETAIFHATFGVFGEKCAQH